MRPVNLFLVTLLIATAASAQKGSIQTFLRTGRNVNDFTEFAWPASTVDGGKMLIIRGDFGRGLLPVFQPTQRKSPKAVSRLHIRRVRLQDVRVQFEIPLKQLAPGEYQVSLKQVIPKELLFQTRDITEDSQDLGTLEIEKKSRR